jgi:hypothetical protein
VIAGTVSDESGRPIPEARVAFQTAPVAVPDIAALTNSEGTFTLSAPAPGRYVVHVSADGFASATAPVMVDSGDAKVTVRLRRE